MMKKLVLLIFLSLFLVACVEEPVCKEPYTEFKTGECCLDENANSICDRDEGATPAEVGEQTSTPDTETPSSVTETAQENMPVTEVKKDPSVPMKDEIPVEERLANGKEDIINHFVDKVKSVQYTYNGAVYYVKPPNVGIILENIKPHGTDEEGENLYIDTVYLEMTQQIAFAGCEAHEAVNERKCAPLWQELVEVGYSNYGSTTPFDWIQRFYEGEMLDYKKKYISVEQRIADYVVFSHDGQTIEMWVDSEFGVPLKVKVGNAQPHVFQQLTINSVTDTDVLPITRTEGVQVI